MSDYSLKKSTLKKFRSKKSAFSSLLIDCSERLSLGGQKMRRLFYTVAMFLFLFGNFTSAFAAPVVTVSFQDGVDGYTGTRDTKLMSDSPATAYGTASKMEVDGSPDRSSLIYWDLTSIPPGSVVQSVDITVNVTNTSSQSYECYQLLQPWIENEATWNQYAFGQSWQVAGADGAEDRDSTVLGSITAPNEGLFTMSLNTAGVAAVQSWVDNPSSNHGFIIQDYINASNGMDFSSRETGTVANRPKLTVTYDSNSQPVLTIDDVTFTEGNVGETGVIFTISLSFADSDPVTVDYTTADGSATTADNDYTAASGQIYFQPGETSQHVTVVVNGDTIEEPNETFIVNLGNATNAAIGDNQGVGTIIDDDGPIVPDIAASPSSHDYGDVAIGTSSNKVFVISNEGTANLNVNSTSLVGTDTGEFSILNGGEPFTLTPGSIHSIDVSFVPVSEGLKDVYLELSSDDPDEGVLDIHLYGNGVFISIPGEPVTFSVTGDYPDFGEMEILEQHIIQHNLYSPSEFFVHVGDILDQGDSCQEASYQNIADRLKTLAVPAFVVIGDNDWIDCPDQAQAFQWWFERFTYFEDHFCGSPVVERQGIRPENWAFVMKGVLFAGINNPSTSADGEDRTIRLQDDADWVDFQLLDKAEQIRAAVVFGHGPPSGSEGVFFDQFKASSIIFSKPVFYIHGHNHEWRLDNPWPDAPNMQRLTVDRGGVEDPVQITATMDPNNPFEIIREPWKNNPLLFNREPCVEAGSDQMISQLDTLDLDGVATDDGVPTNPGSLSTTWSKVSGPGNVVFGDENTLFTTANFTSAGIYELQLTAFDGELASSDEVIVEVQDSGPVLSINDAGIDEGDIGTANAIFTVTLSGASSQIVTVDYATADGSAIAGNDYAAFSGQLSFQPGETTQSITVAVNGDTLMETNETFFVNLNNAVNATITDSQGTGIIIDDDAPNDPPVITLLGANPLDVEFGSSYTDPGATATDDVDGDLTGSIVVGGDTVNTSALGSYIVTYDVSDSAGNAAAQVTRTVNVVDNTKPVIVLSGANPQVIPAGAAYTELGATATDNVDGDISGSIVIDASGVNTAVAGSYTVTYNVVDSSGNAAIEVTRTVTVIPAAEIHIGNIDGRSDSSGKKKWKATVILTVHDSNEDTVSNAEISATWSGGTSGTDVCTTDINGNCSMTSPPIWDSDLSVDFTVDNVTHATMPYDPSMNHISFITINIP
jgi:hypothetical protein